MFRDSEMFRKRYEVGGPMSHKTSFRTFRNHATSRHLIQIYLSRLAIIANLNWKSHRKTWLQSSDRLIDLHLFDTVRKFGLRWKANNRIELVPIPMTNKTPSTVRVKSTTNSSGVSSICSSSSAWDADAFIIWKDHGQYSWHHLGQWKSWKERKLLHLFFDLFPPPSFIIPNGS